MFDYRYQVFDINSNTGKRKPYAFNKKFDLSVETPVMKLHVLMYMWRGTNLR